MSIIDLVFLISGFCLISSTVKDCIGVVCSVDDSYFIFGEF